MNILHRPIQQARRQLWLNRFLVAFGWTFSSAAMCFILLVAIERLFINSAHPGRLLGWGALILFVKSILSALIWSLRTRENIAAAAARLDVAAGLRERLSTGLYCEKMNDPFARAMLTDAEKAAGRITVKQHLPLQVPRSAGWAGGGLVAALLFFLLFPVVDLSGKQEVREKDMLRREEAKRTEAMIRPVIEDQMKKLGEKNPSIKKDIEDLDPLKDAKLDTPSDMKSEAIKKVEKLADKLEQRKNDTALAKTEEFQKMMRKLGDNQKPANAPPVNQLAKSLAEGDFKTAQESLKQIQTELSKEAKTPEEKKQAEEMKAQVQQLADKINKIAQDEKKTHDELAQKGLTPEEIAKAMQQLQNKDMKALAQKLQEKGLTPQQAQQMMQQMAKRSDAAQAAKKLAENMQKGAQGGKKGQKGQQGEKGQQSDQGQPQQAQAGQKGDQKGQGQQAQKGGQSEEGSEGEGFSQASQQLSEMEAQQQELNEIQAAINDLDQLQNNLGQGGQGSGKGDPNRKGNGMGDLGRGQGGIRSREESQTKTVQKRSPINTRKGPINSLQFIDGEQFKGETSEQYREAAIAAKRDVTDAIAKEQIPRPLQQPVSSYFNHAVEGAPAPKSTPSPANPPASK